VPNCRVCGLPLNETDSYCNSCGKPQFEVMQVNGVWPLKFPSKPWTNFSNGFMMGTGAILVIAGLIWLSWLNNNFWQTRQILLATGWSITEINHLLLDNVFLISFCVIAIVIGCYVLIYATLLQFSPSISSLMHCRINRARWGFGSITGGVLLLINSLLGVVPYFYGRDLGLYYAPYFAIAGIFLLFVGSLLVLNAYRNHKSLKS
jgi:hypothetical protein